MNALEDAYFCGLISTSMKITYLGHGCVRIQGAQTTFLIDPFITGNPLAKDIDIEQINCNVILLTHGHVDHVLDAERIARRTGAIIVAGYEVAQWFAAKELNTFAINHGGWWSYPGGRVKYVAAVHSSVLPDGTYGGNPGGFVFEDESKNVYVSGDTALTMDMKLIPMMCKPLDAAVLCIGDCFTMGIDDAVLASDFVNCDKIIGMHYDSFEPIKIDHAQAVQTFAAANKTLLLPEIGTSVEI